MKDKLLLGFAAVTHPLILAPLIYIFLEGDYDWEIVTLNIVLPLLLFSMYKANLADPSKGERKSMYLTIAMTYLLSILFIYWKEGEWLWAHGLFESWLVIMLVMSGMLRKQKISWHGTGWSWLFTYSLGLLYIHGTAEFTVLISVAIALIGVCVVAVRRMQGAHTWPEIFRGFALGILTAALFILITMP